MSVLRIVSLTTAILVMACSTSEQRLIGTYCCMGDVCREYAPKVVVEYIGTNGLTMIPVQYHDRATYTLKPGNGWPDRTESYRFKDDALIIASSSPADPAERRCVLKGKGPMQRAKEAELAKKQDLTLEAKIGVRMLFEGARSYYEDGPGKSHRRFPDPPRTGITPPLGSCCAQPDRQCAVTSELWQEPAWEAMRFSRDDPHRYSYEYSTNDARSTFRARAYGDVDCDGTFSTFELIGSVAADGTITGAGEPRATNPGE